MEYPRGYEWLGTIGLLPKTITEALKEYGTVEKAGTANNPTIMAWAKEVGQKPYYTADSVPWCGLFVALINKRAGKGQIKNPLWALNWANFGKASGQPILGDVLVFQRDGGGHVGFYVGEDKEAYHVLGGNQDNSVCIKRIYKKRLFAARRPRFEFRLPDSARAYVLKTNGMAVSTNEA